MSLSSEQVGDLTATVADLLSIHDEIRNPIEQHALFFLATMLQSLASNPGTTAIALSTLAKTWGVKPRDKQDGTENGGIPV